MNFLSRPLACLALALVSTSVFADPPVIPLDVPNANLPPVFCFRITDVERKLDAAGATVPNAFYFEFEVLNWSDQYAAGLQLSLNGGTSAGVSLGSAFVDRNGRGGADDAVFGDIEEARKQFDGQAHNNPADAIPHHSGKGTINNPNNWTVNSVNTDSTKALFHAPIVPFNSCDGEVCEFNVAAAQIGDEFGFNYDDLVHNEDLLRRARNGFGGLVPGLGTDALGDTAIDGGPLGDTDNYAGLPAGIVPGQDGTVGDFIGAAPPFEGSGNVLDGFVLEVLDLEEGDFLSFNWFLLGESFECFRGDSAQAALGDAPACDGTDPLEYLNPIGTSGFGNEFGFGTVNIGREIQGAGALFEGNTGLTQGINCFGDVCNVKNPTTIGVEFGAGITAPGGSNPFGAQANVRALPAATVPEPGTLALFGAALLGALANAKRKRG